MAYTSGTEVPPEKSPENRYLEYSKYYQYYLKLQEEIFGKLRTSYRSVQLGRMNSILSEMPDHILDEIGVNRADIPSYAHSLIYEASHHPENDAGNTTPSKP